MARLFEDGVIVSHNTCVSDLSHVDVQKLAQPPSGPSIKSLLFDDDEDNMLFVKPEGAGSSSPFVGKAAAGLAGVRKPSPAPHSPVGVALHGKVIDQRHLFDDDDS